jgi:hypothetical protein
MLVLCFGFLINSCQKEEVENTQNAYLASVKWGKMTLRVMTILTKNTPTYGSRILGYMGLTMYESVVQGYPEYNSIIPQITSTLNLPSIDPGQKMNWVLSMNAAQARMIKNLIPYLDNTNLQAIDSLENALKTEFDNGFEEEVNDRSITFGELIADSIFEWSKADGGHLGFNYNFDNKYLFPQNPGNWVPPTKSQVSTKFPLHPYWEKNRTFSPRNASIPVPIAIPYSQSNQSEYYKQMKAVYDKNISLTQDEKDLAAWWADDPSETFSPPGHSYSLANIVVNTSKPSLIRAAETYAKVGTAVADAFINCWKAKYKYFAERPSTYIKIFIDNKFEQFWPEPPFPSFYSGHSVQSAAAATVLEGLYGPTFKIIDNTHEGRIDQEKRGVFYKTRTYDTFWATAVEAAHSRFLGGIHTIQDNEVGLAEGKKIGQNINALVWKK